VHIVPGSEAPELEHAPSNWTSETEATVGRVLSKLLSRAKIDPAARKPQRTGTTAKVPESGAEPPD
jgi:hypothetical protein